MSSLLLLGGELITPLEQRFTALLMTGDRIDSLQDASTFSQSKDCKTLDVSNCFVTPGLIDLQVNGADDCNFWGDPTEAQVESLCKRLLKAGVTSFLPTLITDDVAHLLKNVEFLESLGVGRNGSAAGASGAEVVKKFGIRMPGIHLEGPCLSPAKPGVHPPQWIRPLELDLVKKLARKSVRLITVAPETEPRGESLKYLLESGIHVSLGHSNATYEEANAAFDRGVRLITHTFNALPGIHHRAPGAVTAALLDQRVNCCVIADGLHVDPVVVKLLARTKGLERTVLVTDVAQVGTSDGGLVGSSADLNECVTNMVKWGAATFAEAIRMATWNPAMAVGLQDDRGHLAPGKLADAVVWDKETLAIKHVIVGGQLAF